MRVRACVRVCLSRRVRVCVCVLRGIKLLYCLRLGNSLAWNVLCYSGSTLWEFKVSLLTQNNRSECTECDKYMLIYTAQGKWQEWMKSFVSGTATQLYFEVILQTRDRRNWCSCATGGSRDHRLTFSPSLKTLRLKGFSL